MMQGFHFAHPILLLIGLGFLICAILYYFFKKQFVSLRYSLADNIIKKRAASYHYFWIVDYFLRALIFGLLIVLIGQPQKKSKKSNIPQQGIDIMLVLDMSDSMFKSYDTGTEFNRFEVAKKEAINFIKKRKMDAFGLVIFAADALTRCPTTYDKETIIKIINQLEYNDVPYQYTHIGQSLFTAINRLKNCKAKSKIIILLTDGSPNGNDIPIGVAVEAAKKFDIKIYTIGIGQDMPSYYHSFYLAPLNKELLEQIALATGGQFFLAQNAQDMQDIYKKIDQLEKSDFELPDYYNYYDLHIPLLIIVVILLVIELLVQSIIWFRI